MTREPEEPEEPEVAAKALAAAQKRLTQRPRKVDPGVVVGLRAAGIPVRQAAKALHVEPLTLTKIAREPGVLADIQALRGELKLLKMQRAHALEGRVWSRLEKEVESGEARDVDAVARALGALEKVQVSASGEASRVEVEQRGGPSAVDLQVLIQQVLAPIPE